MVYFQPVDGYLLARYGIIDNTRKHSTMHMAPRHTLTAEDLEDLRDFACMMHGFEPGFSGAAEDAGGTAYDINPQSNQRRNAMADNIVYRVVNCLGDEIGTIEVADTGDDMRNYNAAYAVLQRDYKPGTCGQCGDYSPSLVDPADERDDPEDEGVIIDEA